MLHEIAERACVSQATSIQHSDCQEALYLAVIAKRCRASADSVGRIVAGEGSRQAKLRKLCSYLMNCMFARALRKDVDPVMGWMVLIPSAVLRQHEELAHGEDPDRFARALSDVRERGIPCGQDPPAPHARKGASSRAASRRRSQRKQR